MDDTQLAARAARGDRRACAALAERYRRFLYAVAYKIVLNEEDALDVTQTALLWLVERIGQFSGRGSLRAWLATIATREALSHLRRAGRRPEQATEPAELERRAAEKPRRGGSDPRRAADLAQRREKVEAVMASLAPQQRAIFALRFREEMPPAEIAERLGLPPKQVRSQLHRAIARLKELVAE